MIGFIFALFAIQAFAFTTEVEQSQRCASTICPMYMCINPCTEDQTSTGEWSVKCNSGYNGDCCSDCNDCQCVRTPLHPSSPKRCLTCVYCIQVIINCPEGYEWLPQTCCECGRCEAVVA
jgi:hypothetical protein